MICVYQQSDIKDYHFIALLFKTSVTEDETPDLYTDIDKFCKAIDNLDSQYHYFMFSNDLLPILFKEYILYIKSNTINWNFIHSSFNNEVIELMPKAASSKIIEVL